MGLTVTAVPSKADVHVLNFTEFNTALELNPQQPT